MRYNLKFESNTNEEFVINQRRKSEKQITNREVITNNYSKNRKDRERKNKRHA